MRVGIIALLQESNTFLAEPTRLEHFEREVLLTGEAVRRHFAGAPHEVGGFLDGLAAHGLEAVPLFAARALPFGIIVAADFARLVEMLLAELDRAGPLDGLLVAPHGATVSAAELDADGHWLQRVRDRVGPRLPVVGTLDPHGNLSPRMVAACAALTAYRTNPHLDQRDRGLEAAALLGRTLRGEIRPVMAAAFPPLAINIERQQTEESPCRELYALAEDIRRRPGVLSASVMLGFPYADVAEMGSSVLVVADGDAALARRYADELAGWLWQHRAEFVGHLLGMDAVVAEAARLPAPVCLLDMGDNVGGGSPGDATWLAHALAASGLRPAAVCLADPAAVEAAAAAGEGQRLPLCVGGRSGVEHGAPLADTFTVQRLSDGRFREAEARHGGFTEFDQGRTALLESDSGLTLVVTSRRVPPFSLGQLTSAGVDPAALRVVAAKGVHAPLAAYRPVCRSFLRVDTPGATTADLTRLPYRRRRRPMFPFEPETVAPSGWGWNASVL
jgi:microcystin degradation protein MlrC